MSNPSGVQHISAEQRYLSFSLGAEEYAFPLLSVKEVIALPEITPVPSTPSYFLGIMNLRGQVISVMDLRLKLGIKPLGKNETAVVICDIAGMSVGVVVDSVNHVLNPTAEQISPRPELQGNKHADAITAVFKGEGRLTLFLDIAKALSLADHKLVQSSSQPAKAA